MVNPIITYVTFGVAFLLIVWLMYDRKKNKKKDLAEELKQQEEYNKSKEV